MRKESLASRLIAGSIVLAITMPIGTLATSAFAQTQEPAAQASPVQVPQPQEGGVNWEGVGYGAGSLATNVIYIPAKLVYAILGGLVGGGAFVLTGGNGQTAETIWRSSLGGDYVVTPDMLAGKQPIHFSGPTETPPVTQQNAGVQPITPPATAGAPPPTGSSMSAPSSSSGGASLDSGSGPVNGGHGGMPSTLPNTSIE